MILLRNTLLLLYSFAIISCNSNETVHGLLKSENSIILGFDFGMTKTEYFDYCRQRHNEGLLEQGFGNLSVIFQLDELKYPAEVIFKPSFEHDTLNTASLIIRYKGWAPWNKKMSADSLLIDVENYLESNWGGSKFSTVNAVRDYLQGGISKYREKVDKKRQIVLYPISVNKVEVDFYLEKHD